MKFLSKALVGAGAAALATLTAAAPAQAQYYPYPQQRQGVDLGALARGVAVAGAVSAVVGAITNATRGGVYGGYGNGGYGTYGNGTYSNGAYGTGTYGNGTYGGYGYPNQGYGYGSQNFESAAVNACAGQAQRYGRVSIDNVELRSRSTMRVRGMIEANAGYNAGVYGNYGAGVERRTFDCSFRSDGRITNFDTGRVRY